MANSSIHTVADYLNSLEATRRADVESLHQKIVAAHPDLEARICYGMLGYGPRGAVQDCHWSKLGLGNQKHHISLYFCDVAHQDLLAARRDQLGKVSLGKSCIRFKRLADLNLDTVMEVVDSAARQS